MIGMAIGLAALTAFGSTTIDRIWARISPYLYDGSASLPEPLRPMVPEALWNRPVRDGLVVQALEDWVSAEAARILVGIFLVAALVTAAALVPALALGGRRILAADPTPEAPVAGDQPGGAG
jgi:hypothetical protein